MKLPLYQVDAFADAPFTGNPAAVVPLEAPLDDALLQAIAAENNLSETAYLLPAGAGWGIRWFTPTTEVDLCGHATLASAHVLRHCLGVTDEELVFESRSGELRVRVREDALELDFPARHADPAPAPEGLAEALGVEVQEYLAGPYGMAVIRDEATLRGLSPDLARLGALGKAMIVTAPGDEVDFVSRFFAPSLGVDEDPVTGSAHCTLVPYWAARLQMDRLEARQVSARGGALACRRVGERVWIAGRARLYLEGTIHVS